MNNMENLTLNLTKSRQVWQEILDNGKGYIGFSEEDIKLFKEFIRNQEQNKGRFERLNKYLDEGRRIKHITPKEFDEIWGKKKKWWQ